LDFTVVITHQDLEADESLVFTGTALSTIRSSAGWWRRRPSWRNAGRRRAGNIELG
jgi:hypothetical protein